jgi:hypothetical protein
LAGGARGSQPSPLVLFLFPFPAIQRIARTPPLSFTLTRPSLLLITFTARVATDNPGGTQPPTVEFTAFLDGHPLLLCPGCNPSLYESTTVLGAFDTKTITWVTTAPGGPHKFDVGWGLQGPGIATVSVKTVAIEASRR